jgi:hypothetical protein
MNLLLIYKYYISYLTIGIHTPEGALDGLIQGGYIFMYM